MARKSATKQPLRQLPNDGLLLIVAGYAGLFVAFGFLVDSPRDIVLGVIDICTSRDTLISDYIGIGGMGAAFVNAGLLTLLAGLVYRASGAEITGAAVACLFLVLGFALFGKNIMNIWFIVLGVYLYARFKREPFANHINIAFFGCALAPLFSEILFSTTLSFPVSVPLAIVTSLAVGFILSPVAAQLFKAHMGFNLYNMGFTAGIVGTLVVALYKSYGFVPEPKMIWTTGNNTLLGAFLFGMFVSMIVLGCLLDRRALQGMKKILPLSGQSPNDFIERAGIGATLVNMGLSGMIGTGYVLLVGGDLNGPVIGAIFSIVGFAAYGKHPRNIWPIMAGVFIASMLKDWSATDPSALLAALFGTTLAPIPGRFGWHWGIVAGFIHSSAAMSVASIHAGLNLYNNGFAAGIVASVLVPIIIALQSGGRHGKVPEDEKI
jgi:hypothetical protein